MAGTQNINDILGENVFDMGDTDDDRKTPEIDYPGLVGEISGKWEQAKRDRLFDEQRWLRAYRNYRGLYGPDQVWRETERSRVFVKITKTKVLAAYNHIMEAILGSGQFPVSIEPTQLPEGIPEKAHLDPTQGQGGGQPAGPSRPSYGYPGDGKDPEPGATSAKLMVGPYKDLPWKEGPSPDPSQLPQVDPARLAAKKMQKVIHDQLEEGNAKEAFRHSAFEVCLLGTGVLKGPFIKPKFSHEWTVEDGESTYREIEDTVPGIEAVSVWDFYPDPSAVKLEDAQWVLQLHRMTDTQLRGLLKYKGFIEDTIEDVLFQGPNYERRWFEHILDDRQTQGLFIDRYEVLEYWGTIDKRSAEEAGLDWDIKNHVDEVHVNVWICGGRIIRAIVNPFVPVRIPYLVCPYEINPYQFFGVGIPENMEDSQQIMNGHVRMAIDNLALAGNVILEVDATYLTAGQDYDLYNGKVFERQGGPPGQMINAINVPDVSQSNMYMFDRFRQLSDEQTGITSQLQGQAGHQTGVRSAAQTSMLMNAGSLSIKGVIKNIDDYWLRVLGESYFLWNMQFNPDEDIKGDLHVRALGTSSLMQKEVRSQRLMMFAQVAGGNPMVAPLVNWRQWMVDLAESLDVDPERLINDPDQAKLQAFLIGVQQNGAQQGGGPGAAPPGQQPGMGPGGGMAQGGGENGVSGPQGGTIAPGGGQAPGTSGFSGPTS